MDEELTSGSGTSLLDQFAIAILNGFTANAALQGATEEEVVAKAYEMAQMAMRQRLITLDGFETEAYYLMDEDRYVRQISRPSKTVSYIMNEREALIYFDLNKANDDAAFVQGVGSKAQVCTGKAHITPQGKVTPLPALKPPAPEAPEAE